MFRLVGRWFFENCQRKRRQASVLLCIMYFQVPQLTAYLTVCFQNTFYWTYSRIRLNSFALMVDLRNYSQKDFGWVKSGIFWVKHAGFWAKYVVFRVKHAVFYSKKIFFRSKHTMFWVKHTMFWVKHAVFWVKYAVFSRKWIRFSQKAACFG